MEELKKPMISKEVENGGETVISEEICKIIEYKKRCRYFCKTV